jgi:predicted MPP superfamily phosphohydrolase
MKVRRRFLHPVWLLVSLPGYIGVRLLPALGFGTAGVVWGALLLLAACLIIPASVSTRHLRNRRLADRLAWAGFLTMGFFSSLFVVTVLRDVFLLAAHGLLPAAEAASLTIASARWVLGLTAFTTLGGFIIARRPRLVEVVIPIADLPEGLAGFSITQISDLHVGPTIKRAFVERIVARANALGSDVIALTGDLVDGSVPELSADTAPLRALTARHGVYFVTGNHEYYSGEPAWTAEFRRLGLNALKNQHVILRHGGAALLLAGVNDFSAHHFDPAQCSDPATALLGADRTIHPRILLAHQPSSATAAAAAGFDLQISGHTHGGQFWPWNFFVRYFQPFTAGLNRLGDLSVYVSRGTGYWGPPNRFIVPGEITRLRLVPA